MPRIQRIQPKAPLHDRLVLEAMRLKDEANLPPGSLRDAQDQKSSPSCNRLPCE